MHLPEPFHISWRGSGQGKAFVLPKATKFPINTRISTRNYVANGDEAMKGQQSVKELPRLQHPIIRVDDTGTNKAKMKWGKALRGLMGKTKLGGNGHCGILSQSGRMMNGRIIMEGWNREQFNGGRHMYTASFTRAK